MTFAEFLIAVERWKQDAPLSWRKGQYAFNLLHEVRPLLAEMVRFAPFDPFNRDGVLPEFLTFVGENWVDTITAHGREFLSMAELRRYEYLNPTELS